MFKISSGVLIVGLLAVAGVASPAAAQGTPTPDAVVIGATSDAQKNALSPLRVIGQPARTAGQDIVSITSAGDYTRGLLQRLDVPSQIAYEDEPNVFTLTQRFTGTVLGRNTDGILHVAEALRVDGTASAIVQANGTAAILSWLESDQATDKKLWSLQVDGQVLSLFTLLDAGGGVARPIAFEREGSVLFRPPSRYLLPEVGYELSIGAPWRKVLAIYAGELHVETLVAEDTMATMRGRLLVGPTTILIAPLTVGATVIVVKHNNLTIGDIVHLESDGRVEFLRVLTAATPVNICTRNLNCGGENGDATNWNADVGGGVAATSGVHFRGQYVLSVPAGRVQVYHFAVPYLASTQYTASLHIARDDLADVVPSPTQYGLFIGSGTCHQARAQSVGDGWYRLSATVTTPTPVTTTVVGVCNLPTANAHFLDAAQVELGAFLTPWSEVSSIYGVERSLDLTGANVWEPGTAVFNTGGPGNGFIDLYSRRGLRATSEVGPTICGNVRISTVYNDWAPRWCIGNLQGVYGYGSSTFGVAAGDASATHITADAANGFRIRHGTTDRLVFDTAGNGTLAGNLTFGAAGFLRSGTTTYGTGTGVYLDGLGRAYFGNEAAGNSLKWSGSDLVLKFGGGGATIDNSGLVFQQASGVGEFSKRIRWAGGAMIWDENTSTGFTIEKLGRINLHNPLETGGLIQIKLGTVQHTSFTITDGLIELDAGAVLSKRFRPGTSGDWDLGSTLRTWRDFYWSGTPTLVDGDPIVLDNTKIARKTNVFTGTFNAGGCSVTVAKGLIKSTSGSC